MSQQQAGTLQVDSGGGGAAGSRRGAWWLLGAVLLLATWLRFWGIGYNGLWVDEGHTAYLTAHPVSYYHEQLKADTAPPLYFYLTRPMALLAPRSEAALRAPGAVCGVISVWLVYLLAAELFEDRRAGLLAALLLATNSFHIMRSQEARNYNLYFMFSLGAMVALARLARAGSADGRGRRGALWAGFVLSGAGMIYTHNIAWFFLAGLFLFYPVACWLGGRRGAWYRPILTLAAAGVCIFLIYLPWLGVLRAQLASVISDYWINPPTVERVIEHTGKMAWIGPFVPDGFEGWLISPARVTRWGHGFLAAVWGLTAVGWTWWAVRARGRGWRAVAMVGCVLVSLGALIAFSALRRPLYMDKVTMPIIMIPALGPAALAAVQMRAGTLSRWLKGAGVLLGAWALLMALASHGMQFHEEWREAVRWTVDRARVHGDPILIESGWHLWTVEWYVHGTPYGPIDWDSPTPELLVPRDQRAYLESLPTTAPGTDDPFRARLSSLLGPGRRIWVIQRGDDPLEGGLEEWLTAGARQTLRNEDFITVRVRLFVGLSAGDAGLPAATAADETE